MSDNDYIEAARRQNPSLRNPDSTLKLKVSEFEKALRHAFNAGKRKGEEAEASKKSLFASIFG